MRESIFMTGLAIVMAGSAITADPTIPGQAGPSAAAASISSELLSTAARHGVHAMQDQWAVDSNRAVAPTPPQPSLPAEQRREERETRDLAIQEKMAYWAKLTFFSNLASIAIGAAGLVFLYKTLIATRDAIIETRRIGEFESKAYVGVVEFDLDYLKKKNSVEPRSSGDFYLHWKNTGASPALHARAITHHAFISKDESDKLIPSFNDTKPPHPHEDTILPGDTLHEQITLDNSDLRRWLKGEIVLVVKSQVIYVDVFDNCVNIEWCSKFIVKSVNKKESINLWAERYLYHNSYREYALDKRR